MNVIPSSASSHRGTPVPSGAAAADVRILRGLARDASALRLRAAEAGALFLADEPRRGLDVLERWLEDVGSFLTTLMGVAGAPGHALHGPLARYARGTLALLEALDQALALGQTTSAGMSLALPIARKLASFPGVVTQAMSRSSHDDSRAAHLLEARLTLTPPTRLDAGR